MAWDERDVKDPSNSNPMGRVTSHQTRLLKATSSLALDTSGDGAPTASQGK